MTRWQPLMKTSLFLCLLRLNWAPKDLNFQWMAPRNLSIWVPRTGLSLDFSSVCPTRLVTCISHTVGSSAGPSRQHVYSIGIIPHTLGYSQMSVMARPCSHYQNSNNSRQLRSLHPTKCTMHILASATVGGVTMKPRHLALNADNPKQYCCCLFLSY